MRARRWLTALLLLLLAALTAYRLVDGVVGGVM